MNAFTSLESLLFADINNDIDQMVLLDKQIKELEAQLKARKDAIANKYGEGKHQGNQYTAVVSLSQRNTVAWKKVAEEVEIPADIIAKHTSTTSIITVSAKA